MNTSLAFLRLPVRMLCDRNAQAQRISDDEMRAKLKCDADLALGSDGKGMPAPSTKYFIYYTSGNRGGHYRNDFRLVQVDGFKETVIDEGKAEGFTHAYHEGSAAYTKFGVQGKKLGSFNAYVRLIDEQ